jgi:hypothetical protein
MKRTTVWLFITLLTFTLGVTAAFLYLKFNSSNEQNKENTTNLAPSNFAKETAEIQTLDFCELSNNPEEYDGKVVRLNATLEFGIEGAWFSYSKCFTTKGTTLVFSKNEKIWKPVETARKQKTHEPWANKVSVTVVGKFKNQDPKNCCIIASSQFEIQQVEKASKINQEKY